MENAGASSSEDRASHAPHEAPAGLRHSVTIPCAEEREGLCQLCGREYRVWVAASPLWNAVVRGGSINGDEEFAFLCADCFMGLAEDRGIAAIFRVRADGVTAPLEMVTPSGRIWDDSRFMWVDQKVADSL